MPPAVLVLLLTAAVLHAGWNILLKTADDPLRTAGRGMVVGSAVLIPVAVVGWLVTDRPAIPPEAWAIALASGILEALYFSLLSAAYARGDLSLVYPIARGTAPVLAVAVGIVFLGERLGPMGALGVAFLLIGILSLQRPWAVLRRSSELTPRMRQAAWLAVATGVTIAAYSAVDLNGARMVAPWLYVAMIWGFTATILLVGISLVDRRARRSIGLALASVAVAIETDDVATLGDTTSRDDTAAEAPPAALLRSDDWGRAAVGGLITVGAYLLVLVAFRFAPLSAVAPVRESAIVLVSGWGSFRLGEASTRRAGLTRLAAAAIIVVGAILLALEP
jgi:drug/metabolite transporter (DMT)-like permease